MPPLPSLRRVLILYQIRQVKINLVKHTLFLVTRAYISNWNHTNWLLTRLRLLCKQLFLYLPSNNYGLGLTAF
jgi:hypothetical protein